MDMIENRPNRLGRSPTGQRLISRDGTEEAVHGAQKFCWPAYFEGASAAFRLAK